MKSARRRLIAGLLCMALSAGFLASQAQDNKADVALQAAMKTETVDGNLKGAIDQYKAVAALPGAGRATVAAALLRMGQCHEKLGQTEARAAYERLVRDYADQAGVVAQARARLAAMGGAGVASGAGGPATRRILEDSSAIGDFLTPDGKFIRSLGYDGNVTQFEIAAGQKTTIKNLGPWSKDEGDRLDAQAFSRNGKQIAYTTEQQAEDKEWLTVLKIRNLDGSGLRTLYSGKSEKDYIEPWIWSPDGASLLALRTQKEATDLVLISTADGSMRVLRSVPEGSFSLEKVAYSPDGRFIAFTLMREGRSAQGDIFLMTADGRSEVPVAGHPADDLLVGWTPNGQGLVFLSNRSGTWDMWAVPVAEGKPQGEPGLLKKEFGRDFSILGLASDGSLYYKNETYLGRLYRGEMDLETGQALVPPAPITTRYTGPPILLSWSPDGQNLAYLSRRGFARPGTNIPTIQSTATGAERVLTPRLRFFNQISWAPDSRSLVGIGYGATGKLSAFKIDIETSALTRLTDEVIAPRLCPDGKNLIYVKGGPVVMKRNLETGEESEVVKIKGINYDLSPDGRDIVHWGDGVAQVISVGGGAPRELYRGPVTYARWTGDGRNIVVKVGSDYWRIPAQGGTPVKLALTFDKVIFFTVNPDNRHVAFSVNEGVKRELWVMENFLPAAKAGK